MGVKKVELEWVQIYSQVACCLVCLCFSESQGKLMLIFEIDCNINGLSECKRLANGLHVCHDVKFKVHEPLFFTPK